MGPPGEVREHRRQVVVVGRGALTTGATARLEEARQEGVDEVPVAGLVERTGDAVDEGTGDLAGRSQATGAGVDELTGDAVAGGAPVGGPVQVRAPRPLRWCR